MNFQRRIDQFNVRMAINPFPIIFRSVRPPNISSFTKIMKLHQVSGSIKYNYIEEAKFARQKKVRR